MTPPDPDKHLEGISEIVTVLEVAIFMHKIGDTDRAHDSIRSALSRINASVKNFARVLLGIPYDGDTFL